jgi:hypothetical protein
MNFLNGNTYIDPSHPSHAGYMKTFHFPETDKWETELEETNDSEFWKWLLHQGVRVTTTIRMEKVEAGVWVNMQAFFVNEEQAWFYVAVPYSTFGQLKGSKWQVDKPRYFKYQKCKHEFTGRSVGRCITEYTCKKCGFTQVVDSSD